MCCLFVCLLLDWYLGLVVLFGFGVTVGFSVALLRIVLVFICVYFVACGLRA